MRGILNVNELARQLAREHGNYGFVPGHNNGRGHHFQGKLADGSYVAVQYVPSEAAKRENYLAKATRQATPVRQGNPFTAVNADAEDGVTIRYQLGADGSRRRAFLEGPADVLTPDVLKYVRSQVRANAAVVRAEAEKRAKAEEARARLTERLMERAQAFKTPGIRLTFPYFAVDVDPAPKPAPKKTVKQLALEHLSTWDFKSVYFERLDGLQASVVGQCYNDKGQVAQTKRLHNMALLVAEPDNPHDREAVMVFMWDDGAKKWAHVGYVPAVEAPLLRSRWTGDYKKCAVARITRQPGAAATGHRVDPRIEVELTGEVRTYPAYEKAARAVGL